MIVTTSRPDGWVKQEVGYGRSDSFPMYGGRRIALVLDFLEVQYQAKTVSSD